MFLPDSARTPPAQIAPMGGWVLKVPNQLKSGRYLVRNGLKFRKKSVKFNVNLLKLTIISLNFEKKIAKN